MAAQGERMFQLSEGLAAKLLHYLASKPYVEVHALIEQLQTMQEVATVQVGHEQGEEH